MAPIGRSLTNAVFTITQYDSQQIKLWLDYYSRHYHPDDIFIIDHLFYGRSCCDLIQHRNVITVEHDGCWDCRWLCDYANVFHSNLIKCYRTVLFADADEIIFPDPVQYPGGLQEYLDRFAQSAICATGYEVIQSKDEPAIDLNSKILVEQRKWWTRYTIYNKPVLASGPVTRFPGFHGLVENHPSIDRDLYLAHLKRVDYQRYYDKVVAYGSGYWAVEPFLPPSSDTAYWEKFFYEGMVPGVENRLTERREPIPERFRGIL